MANPFLDFVAATKPTRVPDGPKIVRNATANRNMLFAEIVGNQPEKQVIQGGEHIFDLVRLDKAAGGGFYLPYDKADSSEPSVLSKIKAPWRLHRASFNWSDEQLKLNSGEAAWVRLLENWRAASEQALYEDWETAILATPDPLAETMESMEGYVPQSILALVNEVGTVPTEYSDAGVTTIEGQNPTTKTYWQNQITSYAAAQFAANIEQAMLEMKMLLHWEIPNPKAWVENSELRKMTINTDKAGYKAYWDFLANRENRLFKSDDRANEIGDPTFFNIPIKYRAQLDAQGWPSPRFHWWDWKYLHLVVHSTEFMSEKEPVQDGSRTGVFRVDTLTWANLFCSMRNRLGVVYPV
jgi:hypothetical protein